jgi:hypothetical protein
MKFFGINVQLLYIAHRPNPTPGLSLSHFCDPLCNTLPIALSTREKILSNPALKLLSCI